MFYRFFPLSQLHGQHPRGRAREARPKTKTSSTCRLRRCLRRRPASVQPGGKSRIFLRMRTTMLRRRKLWPPQRRSRLRPRQDRQPPPDRDQRRRSRMRTRARTPIQTHPRPRGVARPQHQELPPPPREQLPRGGHQPVPGVLTPTRTDSDFVFLHIIRVTFLFFFFFQAEPIEQWRLEKQKKTREIMFVSYDMAT